MYGPFAIDSAFPRCVRRTSFPDVAGRRVYVQSIEMTGYRLHLQSIRMTGYRLAAAHKEVTQGRSSRNETPKVRSPPMHSTTSIVQTRSYRLATWLACQFALRGPIFRRFWHPELSESIPRPTSALVAEHLWQSGPRPHSHNSNRWAVS